MTIEVAVRAEGCVSRAGPFWAEGPFVFDEGGVAKESVGGEEETEKECTTNESHYEDKMACSCSEN